MYQIEIRNEKECPKETMKYIDSKRNWNVETQSYRDIEAENCKANLSECQIYWQGEYLILEHNNIIHYWDSFPYCFLKQAVEFIEPDKPAKWKTLDKLIALRCGIRQTEVNCCGYVDEILEDKKMSLETYQEFMRLAKAQDYAHHGSHTF